jgi:hypothetical protein
MVNSEKSAPNGIRKWSIRKKVPQTESENGQSGKRCSKRNPKTVNPEKGAPNGIRKWSIRKKVPQTESENGQSGKKYSKRNPIAFFPFAQSASGSFI